MANRCSYEIIITAIVKILSLMKEFFKGSTLTKEKKKYFHIFFLAFVSFMRN